MQGLCNRIRTDCATAPIGTQRINKNRDSKRTGEFIMPRGKVKWFNNAKGYGFIIEDGCSDDLFAHFSSVQMDGYKTLKAGQAVTFDKKPSDKGIHAVNPTSCLPARRKLTPAATLPDNPASRNQAGTAIRPVQSTPDLFW